MRDRFFLDTNIFVYTFDSREPKKRARAQDLVSDALTRGRGVISHQVPEILVKSDECAALAIGYR